MLIEIWRLELAPPQRKLAPPSPQSISKQSLPVSLVQSALPVLIPPSPTPPVDLPPPSPPYPPFSMRPLRSVQYIAEQYGSKASNTEHALVPLQTYVCDVIRQSRTTRSVLQSALCYIAAIRNKVSVLIDSERGGGDSTDTTSSHRGANRGPPSCVVQHQKLD